MAEYNVKNVLVATTPRFLTLASGERIGSFRVAESLPRGEANWFTVTLPSVVCEAFEHAGIGKGDRINVIGELRVRDWDNGERTGTSVEIEVSAFGKAERSTHECNCPNCAS